MLVERHTYCPRHEPLPNPWRIKAEHLLFFDLIDRCVALASRGYSKAKALGGRPQPFSFQP